MNSNISRLKQIFGISFYAMLGAALVSCGSEQKSKYVCNCEEHKQLQVFVKESIKAANNMSDEEMEDVIKQLRIDGIKIYCKQKPVWVDHNGEVDWEKQKFDSCEVIMEERQTCG